MSNQVPPLTLRLEKGSPLSAEEMDENLKILRDFSNGLASILGVSLNANGTLKTGALNNANQIANGIITAIKLAVDAQVSQPGDVKAVVDTVTVYSTTEDQGWLECVGGTVSRTTFKRLFDRIGTTFGAGDSVTTFGLPDFRRRTLVGKGGTATTVLGNAVGDYGGAETHKLVVTETPPHAHGYISPSTPGDGARGEGARGNGGFDGPGHSYKSAGTTPTDNTTSVGGNLAHNNMQPSAVVRYLIKT